MAFIPKAGISTGFSRAQWRSLKGEFTALSGECGRYAQGSIMLSRDQDPDSGVESHNLKMTSLREQTHIFKLSGFRKHCMHMITNKHTCTAVIVQSFSWKIAA